MTSNEVKAPIGVLIFSGSNQDNHKSTKLIWSPKFGPTVYKAAMSFTLSSRVLLSLKRIALRRKLKRDKQGRFATIRKLWDDFIAQCVKSYIPGPHITVNEQLLAFRGRCAFKMYIANKPAKYGMKLVMACDTESKCMLNIMPHLRKGTTRASSGLTLSLPRSSIDDLVFSVFLSNFFKLSYKISLLKNQFVALFFIRFS